LVRDCQPVSAKKSRDVDWTGVVRRLTSHKTRNSVKIYFGPVGGRCVVDEGRRGSRPFPLGIPSHTPKTFFLSRPLWSGLPLARFFFLPLSFESAAPPVRAVLLCCSCLAWAAPFSTQTLVETRARSRYIHSFFSIYRL